MAGRPAGRAACWDSIGVRVGVFLLAARFPGQSDDEVLAATVQAAVAAERAGFDDVWLAEHHFMSYGICPSAVTLAGYVLGQTGRVAVGTAVSVLSAWHPVALAEQAALLDQVSGGRFRLGVGRGGPWLELEVLGTGLDRYERGFAEGLDLLLAALSRDRVGAAGEFFRFREVPVVPRPRTRPHPPVVVAATSPATAELAAARGLPVLLGLHADDEAKRDMMDCYAAAAARHGVTPARRARGGGRRAGSRHPRGGPGRLLRERLPRWLGPGLAGYVPVDGRARPARDPDAYAEWLCRVHPVGTAADCAERHGRDGAPHRDRSPDLHGRGQRRPRRRPGEHRPARCRGAAPPARAGRAPGRRALAREAGPRAGSARDVTVLAGKQRTRRSAT